MTALPYYENDDGQPGMRAPGLTLREILISVFKDLRIICTVFFVVVAVGIAASFLVTPKYEASSSLLVRMGRDYLTRSGLTAEALPSISSERIVTSEVDILRSPSLVLEAVERLGPARLYPDLVTANGEPPLLLGWVEATGVLALLEPYGLGEGLRAWLTPSAPAASSAELAAERFAKALTIAPGRESHSIFLTFSHPDRAVAEDALTTMLAIYLERRRQIFANPRAMFVHSEALKVRQRVEDLDQQIERFKLAHGIIDFPNQRSALLAQQSGIVTALLQAQNQFAEAEQRLQGLDVMLSQISPDIKLYAENQTSRALDDARSSLLALQLRERAMATRFSDSSIALTEIRQEIAEAQRALRNRERNDNETVRTGTNPLFEQVRIDVIRADAEHRAIAARIGELQTQAADLDKKLRDFDSKGIALAQLERDREVAVESYRLFARQGDEATAIEEFERQNQTNVVVMQAPRTGPQPKDLQPLIVVAALFAGLLAAVVTALIMELQRSSFLTPEKLERVLGVPVLAAIPEATTP